ncbi:hypothetical protein T265_02727 [Opisthorchis viverrini]|uniref:Uncharacterized protein n=1 Tax=Opisthorchis viverrini TaxID=6198 RepID=A0A074ZY50_OPIVI|nr:hypothetical protein T265_02727 [Opisthorchis viverrini]KER30912.1 hypothetical protein T265_02727 [Opisthorchis viverrini]
MGLFRPNRSAVTSKGTTQSRDYEPRNLTTTNGLIGSKRSPNQPIKGTKSHQKARRKRPNHNRTTFTGDQLNVPNGPSRHRRLRPRQIHRRPTKLCKDRFQNYQILFRSYIITGRREGIHPLNPALTMSPRSVMKPCQLACKRFVTIRGDIIISVQLVTKRLEIDWQARRTDQQAPDQKPIWFECEFTHRNVRGPNLTSASRLFLSGLGHSESTSALVLPSGGMVTNRGTIYLFFGAFSQASIHVKTTTKGAQSLLVPKMKSGTVVQRFVHIA